MARRVFISYSHQDNRWKNKLVDHLGVLKGQGLLALWDDGQISTGSKWQTEIGKAIGTAEVAVLLISANYLNSEFVTRTEIPDLLQQGRERGLHIFPILISDCAWESVPWLAGFQLRPSGGKALEGFTAHKRNKELASIAREIGKIVPPSSRGSKTDNSPTLPPAPPAMEDLGNGYKPLSLPAQAGIMLLVFLLVVGGGVFFYREFSPRLANALKKNEGAAAFADRLVTYSGRDVPLKSLIHELASQAGLNSVISAKLKFEERRVAAVSYENGKLGEVMNDLCEAYECRWGIAEGAKSFLTVEPKEVSPESPDGR